ncbi:MAG: FtsW/RodA/SpoVE family cell cycle protein [Atopobiaceae bacterium]|nr:FtsW/RodA/SpoVE family cell cycle protein [Atopobiaceae bacterium]
MTDRRTTELLLLVVGALSVLLIYGMYIVNTGTELSVQSLAVPIGLFLAFAAAHVSIRFLAPEADPAILPIVFVLSGIGISFVTRLAPNLAINQVIWLFVAIAAMIVTLFFVRRLEDLARYKYTIGLIGVVLLLLPALIGGERGGSKLWLFLGPFSFQPGELAKVLIVLFLASYLAQNRELLSVSNIKLGPVSLPRPRMLMPMVLMWGISLLVVIFERDLGSAVLSFAIFVIMLYVATGRVGYVVVSLLLVGIGAYVCYHAFSHVKVRFDIWLDPFADPSNTGLQIVQSLYSLADGNLVGSGIGKGMPRLIPVVESDFIFSAIGEEMGLLGGSAVLLLFMLLAVRGFTTAARAKSDMGAFTAVGLTASISFQAFLIVAGVTRLMPLTGVTLPFMSQGGSSLLASFIVVALLLRAGDEATGREAQLAGDGISSPASVLSGNTSSGPVLTTESGSILSRVESSKSHMAPVDKNNPFARGSFRMSTPESGVLGRVALGNRLTALVSFFAILFAILITNLTFIQVVKAEEYRQMPNNNHTIAKSAYVQRGSILTSDGITLAESVRQENGTYLRSYPSGTLAAHTVGYLSTQYGATGIEASLNGTLTGRADYSNWRGALNSLAGISQPGDSVVLTINSGIQAACENALQGYRGAIVILDPTTGAVLAKASNPSFSYDEIGEIIESDAEGGALVDRSVQSLYPPGSTFKLVTLAAALDSGTAALDAVFDSPASMEIGGGIVTNDHNEEYGQINLTDALAYSANTAYGQLAVKVGAARLVNYAKAFGYGARLGLDFSTIVSLMPEPQEMTEWETAWAGCGQPVGSHASPAGPQATVMQNALVAAAIANNGIVMNPYVVDHVLSPEGTTISSTRPRSLGQAISSFTAEQLKEAMVYAVTNGTGAAAAVYGTEVAGKTGTAQTSSETANSLFVGFAPADSPTLAISVCIEGDQGDVLGVATQLAGTVISESLQVQANGGVS